MKTYNQFGLITLAALFFAGLTTSVAMADLSDVAEEGKIESVANATVGYRGTGVDGYGGRARAYDSLESSPLFNVDLYSDKGDYSIDLGIDYLNEEDYYGDIHFKTEELIQLYLRTERFYHNLDHIPYDNGYTGGEPTAAVPDPAIPSPWLSRPLTGTPVTGSRPDGIPTDILSADQGIRVFYTDQNPADRYGLRLDTNEAKLRIKTPHYPAHFNLAYWRYEKEGSSQLRSVGENCTTACHMQSKTRNIDRITEEIKLGADAHVGFVDLVVESLHRVFRDREAIPRSNFGTHSRDRDVAGNPLEHNEDPDSKMSELTFKANTAPSGGLVGSASFTIGERENNSDLTSVGPISAKTDYYKTTADITYTPGKKWTFNLRYRLLDMDSDNVDQLTAYGNSENPNPLDVRDSVDIERAWYEAIVNYRPSNRLTLKAELLREEIDRSNTGAEIGHDSATHYTRNEPIPPPPAIPDTTIIINPNWDLPGQEIITRAKLGFNSRLLEKSALKIRGWVALQHNDDPAYGTSFGKSRELFLATSYTPSPFWGITANANMLRQENNDHSLHGYSLDRNKDQENLSLGTWLNLEQGVSLDLNYGYFHTVINQDLLFGTSAPFTFEADNAEQRQTVQTITLGVNWQALENLSCRAEAYHSRAKADYALQFNEGPFSYANGAFSALATSADLGDISRVNIRQNGLRGRVNWQVDENWSCSLEASLDDYDERGNDIYDGTVETAMVSLSRRW